MAGPAEWLRLNGQLVAVPSVICERRPAFDAALSQAAWDALADQQRNHLRVSQAGERSGTGDRLVAEVRRGQTTCSRIWLPTLCS